MKRLLIWALALAGTLAASGDELKTSLIRSSAGLRPMVEVKGVYMAGGKFYGYRTPVEGPGEECFDWIFNDADEYHFPVVVVLDSGGNEGNVFCADCNDGLDNEGDRYLNGWMNETRYAYGTLFCYFRGNGSAPAQRMWELARKYGSPSTGLAYLCYYRYKNGDLKATSGNLGPSVNSFKGVAGTFSRNYNLAKDTTQACTTYFENGTGDGNGLQVLEETRFVTVPIRRKQRLDVCETNELRVAFADAEVSYPIVFEVGQAAADVVVEMPESGWFELDKKIGMTIYCAGTPIVSSSILCVGPAANAFDFPYLPGERSTNTLDWGEWTLDYAVASGKVAQTASAQALVLKVTGSPVWNTKAVAMNDGVFSTSNFTAWCEANRIACVVVDNTDLETGASLYSHNKGNNGRSGSPFLSKKGLNPSGLEQPSIGDTFKIELIRPDGSLVGEFAPQFNEEGGCDLNENLCRFDEFLRLVECPDEASNNYAYLTTNVFRRAESVDGKLQISNKRNVYRLEGAFGSEEFVLSAEPKAGTAELPTMLWPTVLAYDKDSDLFTNVYPRVSVYKDGDGKWQVENAYRLAQTEIDAGNIFVEVSAWTEDIHQSEKYGGHTEFEYTLSVKAATPCPGIVTFGAQPEDHIEQALTNITVKVPLYRILGTVGEVKVTVSVDEQMTTASNRYEFTETTLTWADGEESEKTVDLTLLGNELKDGLYNVVLRMSVTNDIPEGIAGKVPDIKQIYNTYSITYGTEPSDKGELSIVTGEMDLQPSADGRYYVHYSPAAGDIAEDFMVKVERTGGLGDAGAILTLKSGGKTLDVETLYWKKYLTGMQTTSVSGFPAPGKNGYTDATITLTSSNGFPVVKAKSVLNVRVVGGNSPAYATSSVSEDLVQYIAYSNEVALAKALPGGWTVMSVSAISGSLPQGLSLKVTPSGAMVVTGTPGRSSGGERQASLWWVLFRDADGNQVRSQPVGFSFKVGSLGGDPSSGEPGVSPGFASARSWSGLPLVDTATGRLAGIFDLTAAKNGRMSARYRKAGGKTVSFSSSALSGIDGDRTVYSEVAKTVSHVDYAVSVAFQANKSVTVTVTDGELPGHDLVAEAGSVLWSRENPADRWNGNYSVAFPLTGSHEPDAATLCFGAAAVQLKMTAVSALNAGRFTFAGTLPNGRAVSGSTTLVPAEVNSAAALLPLFSGSASDTFAALVTIATNGSEKVSAAKVFGTEGVTSYWKHVEANFNNEASYENDYDVFGSRFVYDSDWMPDFAGERGFSLNRNSGMAAGTLRLALDPEKPLRLTTVNWRGAMLPGWENLPMVWGSYSYSTNFVNSSYRKRSVKTGDEITFGE